jgi:hypothetical protein
MMSPTLQMINFFGVIESRKTMEQFDERINRIQA